MVNEEVLLLSHLKDMKTDGECLDNLPKAIHTE